MVKTIENSGIPQPDEISPGDIFVSKMTSITYQVRDIEIRKDGDVALDRIWFTTGQFDHRKTVLDPAKYMRVR